MLFSGPVCCPVPKHAIAKLVFYSMPALLVSLACLILWLLKMFLSLIKRLICGVAYRIECQIRRKKNLGGDSSIPKAVLYNNHFKRKLWSKQQMSSTLNAVTKSF